MGETRRRAKHAVIIAALAAGLRLHKGRYRAGERADITRIAAAHGARNVRVFGSARRCESSAGSDLDLLVNMSEGRSLFDLVALGDDLEKALGVAVDVVTEKSLSPYLWDRILAEAVSL